MKKIKDVLDVTDGIFTTIKQLDSDKYTALFDDMDSETLDIDFYTMCGDRFCSSIFIRTDLETVAKIVLNHFYNSWVHIKELMENDIDSMYPYYRKTTVNQDTSSNNTGDSETNTNNNIFGFDSETSKGDTETLVATKNNADGKTNLQSETTVIGNNGNFLYSEIIEKEIESRTKLFLDLVLHDTENLLTLSIY